MRYLAPEIARFFSEEAKMAFVAGPRQVGKTTLAQHILAQAKMDAFYFNWDIESHRKEIIKNPEDFWKRSAGEMLRPDRNTVLSPEEFWQNLKHGSPRAEASEGLRDLEVLTGFPEPLFSGNESRLRRWRRSYQALVIREDLRDLTRIREIGLIETLVTLLPERIGSPLSVNTLREDLGVAFMTVQAWLETLERLYFLFKIRPFAGRLPRTIRREEKIYLFDFSVIENPGAKFENLVALHLRKLCDAWTDWGFGDFFLYYIRDREKREVDFLITEGKKPYALVEAKLAASAVDSNLRYFADRLKPRYSVQVVREPKGFKSVFTSAGVMITPATHFLSLL